MDENNKDKLINADKKDSDELMEDTIVFTREPDTIIQSTKRTDSSRDTKRQSPRPNPARPQNIPIELQNTAKLQGGAVIRPLKPTRSPNARVVTAEWRASKRSVWQYTSKQLAIKRSVWQYTAKRRASDWRSVGKYAVGQYTFGQQRVWRYAVESDESKRLAAGTDTGRRNVGQST